MAYYGSQNWPAHEPSFDKPSFDKPSFDKPLFDEPVDEPSFDEHFDAGSNMQLRLQQGRAAPAVKSIPASHHLKPHAREHFVDGPVIPYWQRSNYGSGPGIPGWQRRDGLGPVMPYYGWREPFAAARQQNAAPRRRTCNEIFRNIHAPSREQFGGSPYKTMARPRSEQFEPQPTMKERAFEYEQAMEEQAMEAGSYMDQFTAPRSLGNTPREQFRGGHSYASRGGPGGGARAYGGMQNLQNDSSMYPEAPDFAPSSVQELFTVIHPSLKQAGQQPNAFKGPTALRRLM